MTPWCRFDDTTLPILLTAVADPSDTTLIESDKFLVQWLLYDPEEATIDAFDSIWSKNLQHIASVKWVVQYLMGCMFAGVGGGMYVKLK